MAIQLVEAYVLLRIAHKRDMCGFARSVVDKIRKMKQVKDADLLFGEYDAIVHLSANKIHDVENLVVEEMALIEGVESTVTLFCVDEQILK